MGFNRKRSQYVEPDKVAGHFVNGLLRRVAPCGPTSLGFGAAGVVSATQAKPKLRLEAPLSAASGQESQRSRADRPDHGCGQKSLLCKAFSAIAAPVLCHL